MIRVEAVLEIVGGTGRAELDDWVARGWVTPAGGPPDWLFAETDIVRVRLVRTLLYEGGVEPDSVALVLSLLDQVHALRQGLARMAEALAEQPASVRAAVLARLLP